MAIVKRGLVALYLFGILTGGVSLIYWAVRVKDEMNSLGGDIPSAWLLLLPGGFFFWAFKFYEAFSLHVMRDGSPWLWFALALAVPWAMPCIVQNALNGLSEGGR